MKIWNTKRFCWKDQHKEGLTLSVTHKIYHFKAVILFVLIYFKCMRINIWTPCQLTNLNMIWGSHIHWSLLWLSAAWNSWKKIMFWKPPPSPTSKQRFLSITWHSGWPENNLLNRKYVTVDMMWIGLIFLIGEISFVNELYTQRLFFILPDQ